MVALVKSAGPSSSLVAVALVCLCVQNSALVLSMKYTRSVLKETYFTSTAVVVMECVKFALSWMMMYTDGAQTSDVVCQSTTQHTTPQHNTTGLLLHHIPPAACSPLPSADRRCACCVCV